MTSQEHSHLLQLLFSLRKLSGEGVILFPRADSWVPWKESEHREHCVCPTAFLQRLSPAAFFLLELQHVFPDIGQTSKAHIRGPP